MIYIGINSLKKNFKIKIKNGLSWYFEDFNQENNYLIAKNGLKIKNLTKRHWCINLFEDLDEDLFM